MKAWIRKKSNCMTCKGYLNLNFVIDTRKVIGMFPYRELADIRALEADKELAERRARE
jgi:hypothetical protein